MGSMKVDRLDEVLKSIAGLVKQEVLVGVPDSTGGRKDDGEPLSNAEIGYIQETGSPANNIPARPHLVPGVQDARPKFEPQLQKGVEAALDGDLEQVQRRLNMAGIAAQNSVRAKVNSNIAPELAESTLEARRRRGVTRENTLVDTGQYRNSITYVIRKKG
ncbi:hypothetical protein [Burkholderia cepacia]|uniref:Bacteriophage protein n=1 Tax=Burkholderia cepacia TaxID=292 RepID=A0ABN5CX17_BURCE|nr:hypothetical protein [Burkholderia cepacia]AIO23994.1 hypothetical protein DM41_2977 [Burkholderia cepacia ATCC 25416]ALK18517.1 hypothetical protein APZ15_12265 [Burkholderia cepacia ATCC 25416]ASE96008.1 hypothetical protein CEQ23_22020 [Burkholderia cepacia]ATF78989.1 hypothetical protein CO711_17240 [Burkholderia cepacia]MCA8466872.1 hypothetical protein [Burkholderia cepacia]